MAAVGNFDPTIRVGKLGPRIINTPVNDERWKAQLELIRASGAVFDDERREWFLWIDSAQLRPAALDALFAAARQYDTHISVDRVGDEDGEEAS